MGGGAGEYVGAVCGEGRGGKEVLALLAAHCSASLEVGMLEFGSGFAFQPVFLTHATRSAAVVLSKTPRPAKNSASE